MVYKQLEERHVSRPSVTLSTLAKMKAKGEKIATITAYDASFAKLVDDADIEMVLVGDSLGMVIQGHDTTVPVTLQDIVYHCKAVAKGMYRPFLMADMPFMSFTSREQALDNAVRLMQEGGAKIVKLEASAKQIGIVEYLAGHDIPVCAHLGLRPQSVHKVGGFKIQGREQAAADQMIADAKALEAAGADMLLLEQIPSVLGKSITQSVQVPVIGIGAGPHVDGQILVLYDVLDITPGHKPRFVRNFMKGVDSPLQALRNYVQAVKSGEYPAPEHCY
jgi:3-methyl-2-oxobutanoate hydroxymethyltransferase